MLRLQGRLLLFCQDQEAENGSLFIATLSSNKNGIRPDTLNMKHSQFGIYLNHHNLAYEAATVDLGDFNVIIHIT